MKALHNLPASVRQRLLNRAKGESRPFTELLQFFAMERFLYRLSQSPHADHFVLKGALMLQVWQAPRVRPTMDIDLLARNCDPDEDLVTQIRDILAVEVRPDGVFFDMDSIRSEGITEATDFKGTRIRFLGVLDAARIPMKVDICFGDIVYPRVEVAALPTLLDFPAPRLLCYNRETTIAEKLEAIVKHGLSNSRIKDFYDIWLLSHQFDFDGSDLVEAVRLTFEQRGRPVPLKIEAFSAQFIASKETQWTAFRKRIQQDHIPLSFSEVVTSNATFLLPIIAALASDRSSPSLWIAPGPWQ